MAEWFKRLLQSKEEREAEQYRRLLETDTFQQMVRDQAKQLLDESKREAERREAEEEERRRKVLETAEETLSVLTEEMEKSNKPHVVIRSLSFSPEQGIQVKLDYNAAFIRYLTANGVTGKNEDEIVRKWLAMLSNDIMHESITEDYVLNGVPADVSPGIGLEEILRELQKEQGDDENEPDFRR